MKHFLLLMNLVSISGLSVEKQVNQSDVFLVNLQDFLKYNESSLMKLPCKKLYTGKGRYVVKHSQRKDGRSYIFLQMEMVQK